MLRVRVGDAEWQPTVELHNPSNVKEELSGPFMATAVLLHPDGHPVESRQPRPWPMPAARRVYALDPQQSQEIAVGLSLMKDEKAALPPGRYRLVNVSWGELTALTIEADIAR
jgi:hypothetical protein